MIWKWITNESLSASQGIPITDFKWLTDWRCGRMDGRTQLLDDILAPFLPVSIVFVTSFCVVDNPFDNWPLSENGRGETLINVVFFHADYYFLCTYFCWYFDHISLFDQTNRVWHWTRFFKIWYLTVCHTWEGMKFFSHPLKIFLTLNML